MRSYLVTVRIAKVCGWRFITAWRLDSTQSQMKQNNSVIRVVLIESFGLKWVEEIQSHLMIPFYQLSEKTCPNPLLMCLRYTNFVWSVKTNA